MNHWSTFGISPQLITENKGQYLRFNQHFVKESAFKIQPLLILFCYRSGNVCRNQDGEWKVEGMRNGEIRLSRECREGLQDDEWNQDKWPRGGRPY